MNCLAMMMILIGFSPAISQKDYGESGEVQSDPDTSEEILRLKLQTDDLDNSNQMKTIRNGEEYDVGKIFSHLQIAQRPRPVINLRPNGEHTVIHKQNNKYNGGHLDEYIPVKITSDTEYVIKPQHSSHNHHNHGEIIVKPELQDYHHHIPEYSHHGDYNHGYNSHGYNNHGYYDNEYNSHGLSDHGPINHEYFNHGYGHNIHGYGHNNHGYGHNNHEHIHEYNSHKYPHDTHLNHHHVRPDNHYNHAHKPSTHGPYSHPPRPYDEYHSYNKPHESSHDVYKPHYSHGEQNIHHDYKPYNTNGNHDENGHIHHQYHGKPSEYNSHHDNHRPLHGGYESHYNSHSSKPHHGYNNYEVHEHVDDSHHHRPLNYYADHKPHHQHNVQHNHHDNYNQHASSHKPTNNHHKPSEPTHKPQENYYHKPSKPINTHAYHGLPHKYEPHHHGNVWKPYSSSVNVHKVDKHKDKPKYHQQQNQNEQIKRQLESLIYEERNEAVINVNKPESGSNFQKNTSNNHTKEDSQSFPNKPFFGSVPIKKNTTYVGSIATMNSHNIDKNTASSNSGGSNGGHVGSIHAIKHENAHNPHDQEHSRPSTHKNKTSPMIYEINSSNGNHLKPHSMASYENPKPILVHSSNRPAMSTIHESETQFNSNRPDQELAHITVLSHKPYYGNHEHLNNNYYEVTKPALETQLSSNEDSTSIEETSNVYKPLLFKPNNVESSEVLVDNSQEHVVSSYESNQNKPVFNSIEHESSSHNEHQPNTPLFHHDQQNLLHGNHEHENHMQNGQESTDMSGESHHGSYPQDHGHQTHGYHGYNPHRQHSYSHEPSYNPSYHVNHHYDNSDNDKPNKCSSSHGHKLDEYHTEPYRPYHEQPNSHSNHHNYHGKPFNNHHTHQVSKPFNIEHGSPFGVSGIFINNFQKRPNPWYDDGDSRYNSLESLGDDHQIDYRESREYNRGGSSFEKNVEREEKESYSSRPELSESSGYKRFLNLVSKGSRDNISENPQSRRHQYVGFDTHEQESGPKSLVENFQGGMPLIPEFDSQEELNNESYEAEKALTYVMNPSLYGYVSRPHTVHHGLQQSGHHQNVFLDPTHHQHDVYNQIQPHYGHQSNHHAHLIQNPYHYQSLGHETTHSLNHNSNINNVGHHTSYVDNHADLETSHHNHHSNNVPVKYVYIPVLYKYNFQPHIQKHLSKMSPQKTNSSESSMHDHGSSAIVKPSLDILKAPNHASLSLPMKIPQVTEESLPLLWQFLSNPQLMYLNTFTDNDQSNSRDGKEYLRRVEPLEKEELKLEDDKIPNTSNWHQTQELHEDYASKCKDIWDNILLAQQGSEGIKKQRQLFSRSNNDEETILMDLGKEVESLDSGRRGTNTLEPGSVPDLKDTLESTCIEILKNALLSQLEILDIKRREPANSIKNQSQSVKKLEADNEQLLDTVSKSEAPESGSTDLKIDEHKKDDLPILFENQEDELNDREDEQKTDIFSQDYYW